VRRQADAIAVDSELLAALQARVTELEERLAAVEGERNRYKRLYELQREENAHLKRGLIGQKSHRAPEDDAQLTLEVLGLVLGDGQSADGQDLRGVATPRVQMVPAHERRKPVRRPLPENLPRVRVEVVPSEVEREGLDAFEVIGEDVRETLERRPASVVAVQVIKRKYVRKSARGALTTEVLQAETPELPIPRSTAGPGFLADTVVKRWQDHLPLNRQEQIFRREGIELARSTLCTWHQQLAEIAGPLVEAMFANALTEPYLCADATGVLVLHPKRCKRGHFWVLVAPGKHALFRFSMSHDAAAVDRLVGDYKGHLVVDAHTVYDHLFGAGKATEVGCWAHLRQYVLEALATDHERVREGLACIQALFLIERDIGRAPPERRRKVRQDQSKPIVDKFFRWCDEYREHALEGSPLHAAIRYATNQKEAFLRFLEDPRLPMHNNISELNLRRQAIGRRNWLFVGSEDGGRVNTIFVSLLASCQMHGIEPWAYLRDLFCLLPSWPMPRILDLSPLHWKTTLEREEVQHKLDTNIFRRATLLDEPVADPIVVAAS
jgi:transposase